MIFMTVIPAHSGPPTVFLKVQQNGGGGGREGERQRVCTRECEVLRAALLSFRTSQHHSWDSHSRADFPLQGGAGRVSGHHTPSVPSLIVSQVPGDLKSTSISSIIFPPLPVGSLTCRGSTGV